MQGNRIQSFKDLRIWKEGLEIVQDVYKITRGFPKEELYGLTSQMRRAAVSIPSNIAEGFRRKHSREYKQFLHITLGSAAELETQLIIASEINYISKMTVQMICKKIEYLSRMIRVLMRKLK